MPRRSRDWDVIGILAHPAPCASSNGMHKHGAQFSWHGLSLCYVHLAEEKKRVKEAKKAS